MQKGYTSVLHKNTLSYNLVYHLTKNLKLDALTQQEAFVTIDTILTNFEYLEDTKPINE